MKNFLFKKLHTKANEKGETSARRKVLEDLFYDFNQSRAQIYKMNFVRGLFFGLGSVLGGTVLIAVLAWVLSFFVSIPGVGQSVKQVQSSIETNK